MKQKLIITFSLLLLAIVLYLIFTDLFKGSGKDEKNTCDSMFEKISKIDTSQIKYKETRFFKTSFTKLTGIAIDKNSTVYISGTNEVQIFNSNWIKIGGFKIDSTANCIAVGTKKNIFVGIDDHVEKYDLQGVRQMKWIAYSDKGLISSIAVRGDNVFVADAGNHLVLHYDSNGKLLNVIGKKDKAKGIDGLNVPGRFLDVAIGTFDELWVVNPGKHELINFSDKGEFRSTWGVTSGKLEGFAGCCNPAHFCILPDGSFVTYEKGVNRIKIYNQAGKFDGIVANPAIFGGKPEYGCHPAPLVSDLAVDPQGTIYALDATTNGVRVFKKK
jgi:hypothetical protein